MIETTGQVKYINEDEIDIGLFHSRTSKSQFNQTNMVSISLLLLVILYTYVFAESVLGSNPCPPGIKGPGPSKVAKQ